MHSDGRSRRGNALANDERLLDAAVQQIRQFGIDRITTRNVSAAAGLTTGALYARYINLDELLADVWQRRVGSSVTRHITRLFNARTADEGELRSLITAIRQPDDALVVGLELAITARRVDELADVVPADIVEVLAPSRPPLHPQDVLTLAMVAIGLGATATNFVGPIPAPDVRLLVDWFATPLRADRGSPPPPLELAGALVSDPDDQLVDALLLAVQHVVARSGVERTTLTRIGRAARLPASAVYARYAQRDDLIVDLLSRARRGIRSPMARHGLYADSNLLASYASGWVQPTSVIRRRLALETAVAAIHDERLRACVIDTERSIARAAAGPTRELYDDPRVVKNLAGTNIAFGNGLALLAEFVDWLPEVDWRPVGQAIIEGARRSARR